jgi:hypothetical protein
MKGFWEPYDPPESVSRPFTGKQRRYVEQVHRSSRRWGSGTPFPTTASVTPCMTIRAARIVWLSLSFETRSGSWRTCSTTSGERSHPRSK